MKKPKLKKILIGIAVFLGICIILGGLGDSSEDVDNTTAEPNIINLTFGVEGEYGTAMTMESGGMTKEYIAYHIPPGEYFITNKGKYPSQVTVYKDGYAENDDGNLEQISGNQNPIVLAVDATETIKVLEGEYIEIYENAVLELEAK